MRQVFSLLSKKTFSQGGITVQPKENLEFSRHRVRTDVISRSSATHRIYNGTVGIILLLAALPLLIFLSIALFVTQGPRIIYRSDRIGQHGRIFHILMFRTLEDRKVADLTQNEMQLHDSGTKTPLGGFLRDSRLDQLPQLLNIIFGDMNIFGPEPVQPERAEIERRRTSGYDNRFSTKPGLIRPYF